MKFYLGTHRPNWLERVTVPLFVSRRWLPQKDYAPTCEWALDSGGFTELATYGDWRMTEVEYLRIVERVSRWPGFQWAAPMDWMTEPWITAKTGLSIKAHQLRTVANFVRLNWALPRTFVPVLQGQTIEDYALHRRMYADAGVDLRAFTVGLGSVCRRQATGEIEDIVLSLQPLRLHGFGCKTGAIQRVGYLMESGDSMAWSFDGRMQGRCVPTGCGNHLHYALEWREQLLERPWAAYQAHLTEAAL